MMDSQIEALENLSLSNPDNLLSLTRQGDRLVLQIPPKEEEAEIIQKLKYLLEHQEKFWQAQTQVHLVVKERLLDGRQLQALAQQLQDYQLQLRSIATTRRQTAVAAATAGYSVEQESLHLSPVNSTSEAIATQAEPLYIKNTIRSGIEIRHPGTIIILGEVNPGGTVIATGDIFIWGTLRGVAHAGAAGDQSGKILALRMEPTQLRIASLVARASAADTQVGAEVAYVKEGVICITKAVDFLKTHTLTGVGDWQNSSGEKK